MADINNFDQAQLDIKGNGSIAVDIRLGETAGPGDTVSIMVPEEDVSINGKRIAAQVDTISALASITTTNLNGCIVEVLGNTAKGDRNGGKYLYYSTGKSGVTVDAFKIVAGPGADDYFLRVGEIRGETATGNPHLKNPYGTYYGSTTSYITGNITVDVTDAVNSGAAVVYHKDVAPPDITVTPDTVEVVAGTYSTTKGNIIVIVKTPTGIWLIYSSVTGQPINTAAPTLSLPVGHTVALPGENVTTTTGTWDDASTFLYKWYVAGVEQIGEVSNTYTVKAVDIGKAIKSSVAAENTSGQSAYVDSAEITAWHPKDESGVEMVFFANMGAESDLIGTAANDGETVLVWQDQSDNDEDASTTDASTGGTYQENEVNSIYDYIGFDGTEFMELTSTAAKSIFSNVPYGNLMVAVEDTNPTGGDAFHVCFNWSGVAGGVTRLAVGTRENSNSNFYGGTRRMDADAFTTVTSTLTSGYHIVEVEADWSGGNVTLYVDGVSADTDTIATSGNSETGVSDNPATIMANQTAGLKATGNLVAAVAVAPSSQMTAKSRARLSRWMGTAIGVSVTLAE